MEILQIYEQLRSQMDVKFSSTQNQGIKVGFKLPSGENMYYTFQENATVKVCSYVQVNQESLL